MTSPITYLGNPKPKARKNTTHLLVNNTQKIMTQPETLAFNKVHEFSNIYFDSETKTFYHDSSEERVLRFDADGWIFSKLTLKPLPAKHREITHVEKPTFYWELFHPCYSHGFEEFIEIFNTRLDTLGTTSRDIQIFFKNDFCWNHSDNHRTEVLVDKGKGWRFKTEAYNEFLEILSNEEPIFADEERLERQHLYKFSRFFITPCPFARLVHNSGAVINARPMYTNYISYEKIAGWYQTFRDYIFSYYNLPTTTYTEAPNRILVNRKYNRNIHEDSVAALKTHLPDLQVVYLEHMPLKEQVALFSRANVVITVHGAAMFNMIFAPVGALLFEVLPGPSHMRSVFKHYCEKLMRRHAFYYEGTEHRCTLTTHNYPVSVDRLLAALKEVGVA